MFSVYDNHLKYIGLLTDIINAEWVINYQAVNTFTFEIVNSNYSNSRQLLKLGHYIYDKQSQTMMRIEKLRWCDKDRTIYVYGYGVEQMLSWRVIIVDNALTNAEEKIYKYLTDNQRNLIVDAAETQGYTEIYEGAENRLNELLNAIYTICKIAKTDIKMHFMQDTKRFTMQVYKGQDKTYIDGVGGKIFSAERGNIGDLELTLDNLQLKTKAYTSIDEQIISIENEADEVREIYLGTNVKRNTGESDIQYRNRIEAQMRKELEEYKANNELTAIVHNMDILNDIQIGDRVTCKSNEYGFLIDSTIASINKRMDAGVIQVSITFMDTQSRA